jgi:hypothetical protein
MPTLRVLDMASNKLTELPEDFQELSELRIVDFSYNQLASFPAVAKLTKLETLELTDNNLSTVPSELGALPKLWLLKLLGNPIHEIPPEVYFQGLERLKEYLVTMSTKNLPVPQPELELDMALMHAAIGGPTNAAVLLKIAAPLLATAAWAPPVPAAAIGTAAAEAVETAARAAVDGAGARLFSADSDLARRGTVQVTYTQLPAPGADPVPQTVLFRTKLWFLQARLPGLVRFLRRVDTAAAAGDASVEFDYTVDVTAAADALAAAAAGADASAAAPVSVVLTETEAAVLVASVVCPSGVWVRSQCDALAAAKLAAAAEAETAEQDEAAIARVAAAIGALDLYKIDAVLKAVGDAETQRAYAAAARREIFAGAPSLARSFAARWQPDDEEDQFASGPADGDVVELTLVAEPDAPPLRAHRSLLAARSAFFANLFATSSAARAVALEPEAAGGAGVRAALVAYVYTDSHGRKMTPENVCDLLFAAAHLNVGRLRAMAECMVGFNVDVGNVCQVLQMAFFLGSDRLKRACSYFVMTHRGALWSNDYKALQPELRAEIEEMMARAATK